MTTIEERAMNIRRAITDLKLDCYSEMHYAISRGWDDDTDYWLSIIGALDEAEDNMIDAFKRM